jgi:hypothetical protein
VIEKLFFGTGTLLRLKGAEAGDKVVSAIVGLMGDTSSIALKLLEEADGQLEAKRVGSSEDSSG